MNDQSVKNIFMTCSASMNFTIPDRIMQYKKLPKRDSKINLPFKMIGITIPILNFNWIETYSLPSYITMLRVLRCDKHPSLIHIMMNKLSKATFHGL
jgi:hypothetical protein